MPETYTTDFTTVNDDDTENYTPQDLVQKNALINVIDAEAQWKGISETVYNTDYQNKDNSDSAQAYTTTQSKVESNSASGTTSGDAEVQRDSRSTSNSTSGQFGLNDGEVTIDVPSLPLTTQSANTSLELESLEVDYYVVEDSGGSDSGIAVQFDDDPFDAANYDTTKSGISIGGNETKRVGGFSSYIQGTAVYNIFDGASIRYLRTGNRFGTTGLRIDITLNYTIETIEQTINQETIKVKKPYIYNPWQTDGHDVKIYIDGSLDSTRQISYDPGGTVTEQSPTSPGSTKKVVVETPATKRSTVTDTASVNYPSTPNGWSHRRYEIEAFRNGTKVRDDTTYSEREGQSESIISTDPSDSVQIEITGYYSNTTSNTINTVNPSIEGDFIPEGLNTDNVVFAIDSSSSVNKTKQQDIARQVLGQLPDSSNAGLVEFDFDANIVEPLDSLSGNRGDVRNGINSLDNEGGTEIDNALSTARNMLSGIDGSVVLISDGETSVDPTDEAANLGNDGIQIVSIGVDSSGDALDLMEELSDVSGGFFFDGDVDAGFFGTTLSDNELSDWKELNGITRTEQTFTHKIGGTGKAEFRWRFTWEFDTPQPRNGTTGFYDNSADVWREAAVANPDDESLEYNHIIIYNNTESEWGALDVVDISNENAIESHQFYDDKNGWLAPREFDAV